MLMNIEGSSVMLQNLVSKLMCSPAHCDEKGFANKLKVNISPQSLGMIRPWRHTRTHSQSQAAHGELYLRPHMCRVQGAGLKLNWVCSMLGVCMTPLGYP